MNQLLKPDLSKEEVYKLFKETVAPPGTPEPYIWLAIEYAKQLGIDPLRRLVMPINTKQGTKIVVGINALRAVVQRSPEWISTNSAPVYKDDDFKIDAEGNVTHVMQPHKIKEFEKTVGAWATTIRKRQGQLRKFTIFLRTNDYRQTGSNSWERQEAWMICKTAEAFTIRQAFSDLCGGVYIPEEFGKSSLQTHDEEEVVVLPRIEPAPSILDSKFKDCGTCGSPLIQVETPHGFYEFCRDAYKNYQETGDRHELGAHYYKKVNDEPEVSGGSTQGT